MRFNQLKKRREFIALLGGRRRRGHSRRARSSRRLPTIGFLGANTSLADSEWVAAFAQRSRDLGWVEGRTVAIEVRWGEGRGERHAEIAAEFVRRKVDVILTYGTPPPSQQRGRQHPSRSCSQPRGSGRHRTRGFAGAAGRQRDGPVDPADRSCRKRLEILRAVLPDLRTLAIMANIGTPNAVLDMRAAQTAARAFGLDVITSEI